MYSISMKKMNLLMNRQRKNNKIMEEKENQARIKSSL